jgi:tRNA (guanine-N7-)-methyltransferase
MLPGLVAVAEREEPLSRQPAPLPLDRWLPGDRPWEVELGFGKGRYLLRRAESEPRGRFLGVEMVSRYYRMVRRRMRHRGAANLMLLRGEALYLLSAVLPRGIASAVHVYFPDPWPKSRHQRRRLFEADTVDLVLGLLAPGGRLFFATDFLEYGGRVTELLAGHPGLDLMRLTSWPEGPRTNYELKYEREGRPIVRLEARCRGPAGLHPEGRWAVVAATARDGEDEEAAPPSPDGAPPPARGPR